MTNFKQDKGDWEVQYQSGQLDRLCSDQEFTRYKVLASYIEKCRRNISLLDIGCGEGLILKHLNLDLIEKYTGLDLAQTALGRISPKREQDDFICSSLEEYRPSETWDVILFNEILYYTDDPVAQLRKFEESLKEGGFFLVSMHRKRNPLAYNNRCIRRLRNYFKEARYLVQDAVEISKIYQPVAWQVFVVQPPGS